MLFRSGNDGIFPLVILGLKNNENLFVGKQGEWLGHYIPAYIRRYPFILAEDKNNSGNFAVCIDEGYPGFNKKNDGTKLFADDGTESPLLQKSIAFLKEYQNHIQQTRIFCSKINELKLLEPMQARLQLVSECVVTADQRLPTGSEAVVGHHRGDRREQADGRGDQRFRNARSNG